MLTDRVVILLITQLSASCQLIVSFIHQLKEYFYTNHVCGFYNSLSTRPCIVAPVEAVSIIGLQSMGLLVSVNSYANLNPDLCTVNVNYVSSAFIILQEMKNKTVMYVSIHHTVRQISFNIKTRCKYESLIVNSVVDRMNLSQHCLTNTALVYHTYTYIYLTSCNHHFQSQNSAETIIFVLESTETTAVKLCSLKLITYSTA